MSSNFIKTEAKTRKTRPHEAGTSHDPASSLGDRLRSLLHRHGDSLENLAAFSGLSKRKLEGLAMGEVVPTINHLWKIANALGVPFGSLINVPKNRDDPVFRKAAKKVVTSNDGLFTSRALLPHDSQRPVEFYELTIAPNHVVRSEAHGAGTRESLVVVRGHLEITAGKEPSQRLEEGDAMVFDGDVPHSYRNLGATEALVYLVMSYVNIGDA